MCWGFMDGRRRVWLMARSFELGWDADMNICC